MFGLGRKFACYSGLAIVTFVCVTSCDPSGSSGDRQKAVRINEVMARNRSTVVVDDLGRPIIQDWVELYNPTGRTASLNGLTLSDDPDEPDKYRFPAGRTLAPGEFLIVYVFDPEDCEPRCRQELEECRAALIDPAQPEEVAECDLEFEECLANCEVSGLIADFGFGANDTIYLFERDGERLSDRVGVTEPEQDISVGRFPDGTGGYGVIYAGPTPGEPNMPTDLGPLSIEPGIEFDTIIPDCSENVEARFHVTLDEDRKGSLQVRFEYADVGNCSGPETPEDTSFTDEGVLLSIESEEQLPPEDRIDIEIETVSVARVRITYRALLPGAACGTARITRVVASVEGLEQRRVGDCSTWDEEQQLPTLAFNEYVPRNSVLEFNFIRGEDVGTPGSIPVPAGNRLDWIEIVNYGDQPIDISDFALVGLREWNRFLRGEQEALEPGLFLD
ncbi:MAG: lamin tail domain-containing protein [Planctomycetes bacterium]|nr:lamin tail domain-containing protein [Planctomycetota bacterium]